MPRDELVVVVLRVVVVVVPRVPVLRDVLEPVDGAWYVPREPLLPRLVITPVLLVPLPLEPPVT